MIVQQADFISIDPGDTSGWATFNLTTGDLIEWDQVGNGGKGLLTLLDAVQPKLILCEDYKLYPWKAGEQSWSRLTTVKFIGWVECWADQHNVKVVLQGTDKKPIAYRYAGMTPPKNHNKSHGPDAYVHGVYYLQTNKIRRPQQGDRQHPQ